MKIIISLLAVILSTNAALATQAASYSGKGSWKTDKARTTGGTYVINMDVMRLGSGKNQVVTELVGTFGGTSYHWDYIAVQRKVGSSFYDLFIGSKKSGWGFCITTDNNRGKKCTYNVKTDDINHQLTFVIQGGEIIRMGSHEDTAGNHFVWRDHLTPVEPTPLDALEDGELSP